MNFSSVCSKSWQLGIADCFKHQRLLLKRCQKHRGSISHIERRVNVLVEDPSKITLMNASIDEQKALKRDHIYNIENTDLEIGVSAVLLRILQYGARRCSRQTGSFYTLSINLLKYNDPKDITQRLWYIYNK